MTAPAPSVLDGDREPAGGSRAAWQVRFDELHAGPGLMPGPWEWCIHDHSMATLCGGGEDAIVGNLMSISPCRACAKRGREGGWVWGRCGTPDAKLAQAITAIPNMVSALQRIAAATPNNANTATVEGFMSHIRSIANTALADLAVPGAPS